VPRFASVLWTLTWDFEDVGAFSAPDLNHPTVPAIRRATAAASAFVPSLSVSRPLRLPQSKAPWVVLVSPAPSRAQSPPKTSLRSFLQRLLDLSRRRLRGHRRAFLRSLDLHAAPQHRTLIDPDALCHDLPLGDREC